MSPHTFHGPYKEWMPYEKQKYEHERKQSDSPYSVLSGKRETSDI